MSETNGSFQKGNDLFDPYTSIPARSLWKCFLISRQPVSMCESDLSPIRSQPLLLLRQSTGFLSIICVQLLSSINILVNFQLQFSDKQHWLPRESVTSQDRTMLAALRSVRSYHQF
jgi:hypothetical protein